LKTQTPLALDPVRPSSARLSTSPQEVRKGTGSPRSTAQQVCSTHSRGTCTDQAKGSPAAHRLGWCT